MESVIVGLPYSAVSSTVSVVLGQSAETQTFKGIAQAHSFSI